MPSCHQCGVESSSLNPQCLCPACQDRAKEHELMGGSGDTTRFGQALLNRPFGGYELLHEIARGGMGTIYKARQRTLDRVVAVKVLSGGAFASPEYQSRFKAEAAAAARLQHPHIVAIHEVGFWEGVHFFSMDYIDGPNLSQLVDGRPLAWDTSARYLKALAEAVQYAHERGVLHRDLKPSNVLIDAFGEPKLTDFGLAKDLLGDSDLTMTGQVLGTPGYLAPEQADTSLHPVSPASDVYSLGAILYFMLTTRAPFAAGSLHDTLRQALTMEAVAPSLLNPAIPRDLETICLKCLERDPSRRYATAAALAEDCARFLRRDPILARPVSAPERFSRWCRRRPAQAAIALLVLALAATSTLSTFWIAAEQRRTESALHQFRESEARALRNLRAAKLAEAKAIRRSTLPGRRKLALDALAEASKIRPGADLRDEAVGVLMLPDVRVVDQWNFNPRTPGELNYAPGAGVLAYERRNSVGNERELPELYRWKEDKPFVTLTNQGTHRVVGPFRFSPDGRLLLAKFLDHTARLWRVGEPQPYLVLTNLPLASLEIPSSPLNSDYEFSPDGTRFVIGVGGRGLSLRRSSDGAELRRWEAPENLSLVRFSPDGSRIAAINAIDPKERRIHLFQAESLNPEEPIQLSAAPSFIAWSSDSRVLVVSTPDRMIQSYDVPARRLLSVHMNPGQGSGECVLLGENLLLGLRGSGTTLRLLDPNIGKELMVIDGFGPAAVSSDARGLNFVISSVDGISTRWGVTPPVGYQVIPVPRPSGYTMTINSCSFDFHPVEPWELSGHGRFLLLRDSVTGRFLAEYDAGSPQGFDFALVSFSADGRQALRFSSAKGIQSFDLTPDGKGSVSLGPPTTLDSTSGFLMTDHTADRTRFVCVSPEANRVRVLEAKDGQVREIKAWKVQDPYSAALDPKGERVVVNCGSEEPNAPLRVRVYAVATGEPVAELPVRPVGETAWSADGSVLMTSNGPEESTLWDSATWKPRLVLRGRLGGNITTFALAPDGASVVIARDEQVNLVDARSGAVMARFECPEASGLAAGVRFLPDGRRFAVLWRDGRVDVLNPAALQAELALHGLGW